MTEGKGREGVGEGKKNLSKDSFLERKQDFIKILKEPQLVPISIALSGLEFSIYLVLFFFFWASHGLS